MTCNPRVGSAVSEATFRARMAVLGCTELREVTWTPEHRPDLHRHDFDAHGLVLDGEFTLVSPRGDCLLRAGDEFRLAAGIQHAEHAGPAGTRLLAGRLSPREA